LCRYRRNISAPRRGAILRRALLATGAIPLPRCHFGGAIIQRAAHPLCATLAYCVAFTISALPSFGNAAMTPRAVAASFCAACTALSSALLFFPHCAAVEFILNFKSASMPREI